MNIGIAIFIIVSYLHQSFAAPLNHEEPDYLLHYRNEKVGTDGYEFRYETSQGSNREESGGFIDGIWTVKGFFTWTSPDGKFNYVMYYADDKGYRAEYIPQFTPPSVDDFPSGPGYVAHGAPPGHMYSKNALCALVAGCNLNKDKMERKMKMKFANKVGF